MGDTSTIGKTIRGIHNRLQRKKTVKSKRQLSQNATKVVFTATNNTCNFKNNVYYLPYNKNLKAFSRKLRNNSTLGEILLWQKLKAGSIMNYTFDRQKPLGRYIVDFYCKPLKLIIEIDGGYHFEEEQKIKDNHRQIILEQMGLNFLRFHDEQIRKDMNIVLKIIENYISDFEK